MHLLVWSLIKISRVSGALLFVMNACIVARGLCCGLSFVVGMELVPEFFFIALGVFEMEEAALQVSALPVFHAFIADLWVIVSAFVAESTVAKCHHVSAPFGVIKL